MPRPTWTTSLSVALLAACAPTASPQATVAAVAAAELQGAVFAEVGGVAITDAQLVAFEDVDPAAAAAGSLRYPQLLAKVEDRVRFELLAQAAAARQLAQDPEVVEATRKAMVRKLLAVEFAADKLGVEVAEDVLREVYMRHEADFLRPEARRFTLLRFANDAWGRAQAETFARGWHAEADDASHLAAALRVPPPMAAVGRGARRRRRPRNQPHWQSEPFLTRADVARRHGDEVADAVFAAPPMQFPAAVVQTQAGAVAVRVLACRGRVLRPFAEARAEILEQLVRRRRTEKFSAFLEALRAKAPWVVHEDRMRAWLAHPPVATSSAAAAGLAPLGAAAAMGELDPPSSPQAGPMPAPAEALSPATGAAAPPEAVSPLPPKAPGAPGTGPGAVDVHANDEASPATPQRALDGAPAGGGPT